MKPNVEFLNWIEKMESSGAAAMQASLADDFVLGSLSQAWKTGLAASHQLPRAFTEPLVLARGDAPDGSSLGVNYPSGLVSEIRNLWAAAAASVGWNELAKAVTDSSRPVFAPTPSQIVAERGGFRLRAVTRPGRGEPIVLIAPLVNRWYILDFSPEASLVAALAETGRPIYIIEPTTPNSDDERSVADLCAGPLLALLEHAVSRHDTEGVALIGYSTGGTLAAILAARYPSLVRRLATLCAPIQFERGGVMTQWFSPRYLDVEDVATSYGRIPAWLVHLPFWWLHPSTKTAKLTRLARSSDSAAFVDRFLALEVWNHDNIDMGRGVFRSWMGGLYQRDELVKGEMVVDGEAVQLANIRCPVVVISGAHDDVIPPAAAEALADECSSTWARKLCIETSHVGVLSSRRHLATQMTMFSEWMKVGASNV
jgi:polyhydroxyalkanoate synthase